MQPRLALILLFTLAPIPHLVAEESPPEAVIKEAAKEAPPVAESGTLTTVLGNHPEFTIFRKALTLAELDAILGDTDKDYTLFAPDDAAFDKLPVGTLGKLMLPENKAKLRELLLKHVISGRVPAAKLKDGSYESLQGEPIEVKVVAEGISIAKHSVKSADVDARNGLIHHIDGVLIPKSLAGFWGFEKSP